jgi:hypothetical protein
MFFELGLSRWSCRRIETRCSPTFSVNITQLLTYVSAAALWLIVTALIVAGNQRVLPRAVGIPSAINPSAIA